MKMKFTATRIQHFTTINGVSKNHLARLNANGTVDATFNIGNGVESGLWTIALQTDGKIIIGGLFSSYNGNSCSSLARINSNGTFDPTLVTTGTNYFVYSCSVQSDGKIVVGGAFDTFNNVATSGVARLNSDGSIDNGFNCTSFGTTATIYGTALQNDGKILAAGVFPAHNGFTGNNILRLNIDGSLDDTFITGTGFDAYVSALTLQPDGKILAGGNFENYNNVEREYIARLFSTTVLSTPNFNDDTKIVVYPNPVTESLRIILPYNSTNAGYEAFDITGKKVDSKILSSDSIDVRNYAPGIYFLRVKTDSGIYFQKFIKK
jgi:uncharacterized delta-60 repeat protein